MKGEVSMSTSTVAVATPRKFAKRIPLTFVVALIPVAVALNIVGSEINTILHLPTFLDMIGTCVVAIVLGPWWGALAGAATNIILAFLTGPIALPFAACNVVGALIWGYTIRWGWGKKFWSYGLINIVVAFFVTLTAVPIYVFVFGGAAGHFADMMTAAFLAMGQNLIVSVFSSNILVSLADKIISGFVALAIIEALPATLTKGLQLPKSEGIGKIAWIAGGIALGLAIALIMLAVKK
jgi:energy-coupling factor transport system substrate-specific component